ncbi:MAG: hypothetical protein HYU97_00815 [Deltaproteobacteria bacterium]|nr:hypothetical protein [Deltaproteobacteria bacterium]
MGKRRKKRDYYTRALVFILIACGAVLLYEQLDHWSSNGSSVKRPATVVNTAPLASAPSTDSLFQTVAPEKVLPLLPLDAIDQNFTGLHHNDYTILAYAQGKNLDNPDLGKPKIMVLKKDPTGGTHKELLDFAPIKDQLKGEPLGPPQLSAKPIIDKQGIPFFLVRTFVREDVLKTATVMYLQAGKPAWAKLKEDNELSLATFLEGNSAVTSTQVTLGEEKGIPLLRVKTGNFEKFNTHVYQWNGSAFVKVGLH